MNDVSDDGFDPDEIEAIEKIMDEIMAEESTGYQMVFWVTVGAAKELLETYDEFLAGSKSAGELCLREFGKIAEQLREAVVNDEENN
jgi:hypothetical protein